MHENTRPDMELTWPTEADAETTSNADRLDEIETLLRKPRDYFEQMKRPIKSDFENDVEPVIQAIELLVEEVRELRDRL